MPNRSRRAPVSKRYARIYKDYYQLVSDERYADLFRAAAAFALGPLKNFCNIETEFNFIIDEQRLRHAIVSYFFDIIRHKEFHFSGFSEKKEDEDSIHKDEKDRGKHINAAKQAAFMLKWLVRVKPFMLVPLVSNLTCSNEECPQKECAPIALNEQQREIAITINEIIGLHYCCAVLNIDANAEGEWVDRIIYTAHYRGVDEGQFIEIFETKMEATTRRSKAALRGKNRSAVRGK